MKTFSRFLEYFDADEKAEQLKKEREDRLKQMQDKAAQDKKDEKEKDMEKKYITVDDLNDAEAEAEKDDDKGDKISFIDILKKRKG